MRCRVVAPEELTEYEIKVLFSLTLRGISELRNRFRKVISYLREQPTDPNRRKEANVTIILAKEDGQINGWGMINWDKSCSYLQVNVRTSLRRSGVGTSIVKTAIEVCRKRQARKPTVDIWDDRSKKFYQKFGKQLHLKY
jgi:N-acetylglutamate synthase-like GNAT family acetyltransferase